MRLDVIRAVESCYACAERDQDWLAGVLEALRPLDTGLGTFIQLFRMTPRGERVVAATSVGPNLPPGLLERIEDCYATMGRPPDMYSSRAPVTFALKRAREIGKRDVVARFLETEGAEDVLGIFAAEPDGRTVLACAHVPRGRPLHLPRTLHQLTLLSAHLGAAARLRDATAFASSATEAVLTPGGRILDAAGAAKPQEARRTLADAVRRMERARGSLRRTDPEEALQLWQGLVEGTWSLVDQCEADGKRYVLARRNPPGVRDPKALTPCERCVLAFAAMGHQNKLIGYLLGFSPSAVAAHLRSAQRKLGLGSRAALVQLFGSLVQPGAAGSPHVAKRLTR